MRLPDILRPPCQPAMQLPTGYPQEAEPLKNHSQNRPSAVER